MEQDPLEGDQERVEALGDVVVEWEEAEVEVGADSARVRAPEVVVYVRVAGKAHPISRGYHVLK